MSAFLSRELRLTDLIMIKFIHLYKISSSCLQTAVDFKLFGCCCRGYYVSKVTEWMRAHYEFLTSQTVFSVIFCS